MIACIFWRCFSNNFLKKHSSWIIQMTSRSCPHHQSTWVWIPGWCKEFLLLFYTNSVLREVRKPFRGEVKWWRELNNSICALIINLLSFFRLHTLCVLYLKINLKHNLCSLHVFKRSERGVLFILCYISQTAFLTTKNLYKKYK